MSTATATTTRKVWKSWNKIVGPAFLAVKRDGMSVREAAEQFGSGIKLRANARTTDAVEVFAREVDKIADFEANPECGVNIPDLERIQRNLTIFDSLPRPVSLATVKTAEDKNRELAAESASLQSAIDDLLD